MVTRIRFFATTAALAGLGWFGHPALAQSTGAVPPGIITSRPADSVSNAGSRAPGNIVSAGVARTQGRHDSFFSVPEITETAPARTPQTEFLLDAIPVMFEELNRAIFTLATAIFAREGIEAADLGPQLVNQIIGTALGNANGVGGLLQKRTEERLQARALR